MTDVPLPVVESGPEALFRLGTIEVDGSTVRASMPAGDWLAGPGGRPLAGSLGVLVDNVLGYAIIARRPPEHWSVSTEITLDVLEPLPFGGRIHATGQVLHADALGGFATGRVTDDAGRVLAVATQRGRFIRASGVGLAPAAYTKVAGSDDVVPWLGRTFVDGGALVAPDLLANPLGNVHGGISLCLSDLLARSTAAEHLTTASVHIAYTRAIPVGATLSYAAVPRHAGRGLAVVEVTGSVDGRPGTVSTVVLHPRQD